MYKTNGYIYDDENLALIPEAYFSSENKAIISKYTKNNAEYGKVQSILEEKIQQDYTAQNKLLTVGGIAVTYDCQLRCSYCSNNSTENSIYKTDLADVKVFINYLIKNVKIKRLINPESNTLTIYLSGGGEPTYDWHLFCDVVHLIRDLCGNNDIDCKINLTTNGILDESKARFIVNNIDSVMVSFDGHPDVQNENRRFFDKSKTADVVIDTIHNFDEENCNYSIRTTLWHNQLARLNDMFHFIYDNFHNFGTWSINPVVSAGRAKNYSTNVSDAEIDRFFSYYINIKEEAIAKYAKSNLGLLFITNELCGIICGIADANSPFLYPNKNIGICVDAADLSPVVGRISDGKVVLKQSYSKDIFMKYCERYNSCKGCVAFRFCAGGCPIKRMRKNNIASSDFECAVTKKYYQYLLDCISKGQQIYGWFGQKIHIPELKCDIIQITNSVIESQ